MKSIEKAKLLDFILKEMIKHQERTKSNNYSYNFIVGLFHGLSKESNSFAKEVSMDYDKAKDLFHLIYNQDFDESPILKQNEGNSSKNYGNPYYNTHDFLKSGGFRALYEAENQTSNKITKKEGYDYRISRNQALLSTRQKFTFWITFAFSIIALGLSIYNTFFSSKE